MSLFFNSLDQKIASFPDLRNHFNLWTIQQNINQHSDLIIINILIDALTTNKKNYAHYLSLSKKMGKSIEGFISNNSLRYVESFMSEWCYDLPITQINPYTYATPSNKIQIIEKSILAQKLVIDEKEPFVIVDCVKFLEKNPQIIYSLYENTIKNNGKLVLGGCDSSLLSNIFIRQSDIHIKIQNDVGNNGKFILNSNNNRYEFLWKWNQNKFEIVNSLNI